MRFKLNLLFVALIFAGSCLFTACVKDEGFIPKGDEGSQYYGDVPPPSYDPEDGIYEDTTGTQSNAGTGHYSGPHPVLHPQHPK